MHLLSKSADPEADHASVWVKMTFLTFLNELVELGFFLFFFPKPGGKRRLLKNLKPITEAGNACFSDNSIIYPASSWVGGAAP